MSTALPPAQDTVTAGNDEGRRVQCCGCDEAYDGAKPTGWINEKWRTLGGGLLRVVLCYACRHRPRLGDRRVTP